MNKERELEVKLQLLHLAGGDPDHAQQMLDWLLLPAKNEEDTTIKIEPDAIAALSPAPSEGDALGEVEGESVQGRYAAISVDGIALKENEIAPGVRVFSGSSTDALFVSEIPEGFTRHYGGECPIEDGSTVEIITSRGVQYIADNPFCTRWRWSHDEGCVNIIAYRVLPSEPAAEAKGEEALADFMMREGAKLYPADFYALPDDTVPTDRVSCLLSSGISIGPCEADGVDWEDRNPPHIRAYINHTRLALEKLDETAPRDEPDTITIASSSQHAEESARAQSLPPLLPPERPPVATPEQLEATGVIDGEAGWWGRKLMKERA